MFPKLTLVEIVHQVGILLKQKPPPAAQLAHALSSFVKKKGSPSEPLLGPWVDALQAGCDALGPKELSGVMVACRRLKVRSVSIWVRLSAVAVAKADSFEAREIANTLNAASQHGYRDQALLKAMAKMITKRSTSFNSQDIANTLNAMAKFEHADKGVVEVLLREVPRKARDFNSQDIANTLNAMAKFEHADKGVVEVLLREVPRNAPDFTSQNISNTLLATASMQCNDSTVLVCMLNELARLDPAKAGTEELSQLYQVQLWLSTEQQAWGLQLPATWAPVVDRAWASQLSSVSSSRLHMQVSSALRHMGVQHSNEGQVGGLSVDIIFEPLEEGGEPPRVVLEVDGPSHFCTNDTRRPLGPTVFKRRLLAAQGWQVVSVPYFDWAQLGSAADKQQYLRGKLQGLPVRYLV